MNLVQHTEYLVSTVDTDGLVLQHQDISSYHAISSYSAEYVPMHSQLFIGYTQIKAQQHFQHQLKCYLAIQEVNFFVELAWQHLYALHTWHWYMLRGLWLKSEKGVRLAMALNILSSRTSMWVVTCRRQSKQTLTERGSNHFKSIILKLVLWVDSLNTSCEVTLKWMPQNVTAKRSTLVQVMNWCRQAIIRGIITQGIQQTLYWPSLTYDKASACHCLTALFSDSPLLVPPPL